MNSKLRVLIPIVGQGSIVHIIRTGMLAKLNEFITPIIGIAWQQDDLIEELTQLGYEVVRLPKYNVSGEYIALRNKITLWYFKYRLKSPTTKILRSYLNLYEPHSKVYKRKLKNAIVYARFIFQPKYIEQLKAEEANLIKQQICYKEFENFVEEKKLDSIFTVTPFYQEIELIGRILKKRGKKILASIHSFDNITTRQWPAIFFDHYLVWNKYNKQELERINPLLKKNNAITVCGAPQFDFHFRENFTWSRSEWLKKLSLPNDKKIILYGGGPVSLFKDEPQYLQHLNEAFIEKKIDGNTTVILFRSHPLDQRSRWQKYAGNSPYIIYDAAQSGKEKFDYINVTEDDIRKLISTMKHSDVQINFISTMTVDGSAFYKPQIGPFYTEIKKRKRSRLTRLMYMQEHYLPITKSGGLNLPASKEEFIKTVVGALQDPEKFSHHTDKCLEEIITFKDGKSTERAVAAIKLFYES